MLKKIIAFNIHCKPLSSIREPITGKNKKQTDKPDEIFLRFSLTNITIRK